MNKYTTKEICERFGISAQKMQRWRKGDKSRARGGEYIYPPLLIKGADWDYEDRNIIYFDSAIEKITKATGII